jgi:hypothetical protein
MGKYKYSNRRKSPKPTPTRSCVRCQRDLYAGNNTAVCDREYAECGRIEANLRAIRAEVNALCVIR